VRAFSTFSVIGCFALLACAAQQQQSSWIKPGATAHEFSSNRDACMQQSQQPNSAALEKGNGGVASSKMTTNADLFGACMNARGYYLVSVTDTEGANDALSAVYADAAQACSRPDLQVIFAKKMPCKAKEPTPEQLSDRSKISEAEKTALMKWRQLVEETAQKVEVIDRQYYPEKGNAFASLVERQTAAGLQLGSQLHDRQISWGEYNKRRSELTSRQEQEAKAALH
jgi:hypothetical protein